MPTLYLPNDDRGRRIAALVRRAAPAYQVLEKPDRLVVEGSADLRLRRAQVEEALGEPLTDDAWRQLFARAIGEVAVYDDQHFAIEEYLPDEG